MGRMRNRSGNSAMCEVCKWIEQPAQQSQCKPLAAAQSQQLTDRSGPKPKPKAKRAEKLQTTKNYTKKQKKKEKRQL